MCGTRKVLLLVENAPVPGDPRVWHEAVTLRAAGYQVCIIAPQSTHQARETCSCVDGIYIYRFRVYEACSGVFAYVLEYILAFWRIFWLSLKVWRRHGFDVLHAANPPDIFCLLGLFYRCWGKKFVFDQHDLAPELFRVVFQKRFTPVYKLLLYLERCSYRAAHVVLSPNRSYWHLALTRGHCAPDKVFVVRNGPDLEQFSVEKSLPEPFFPQKRRYVLVYAGIMGKQDGVEYALYALYYLISICGRRDVSAVFLGTGSALDMLQRLMHQLGLDEYVFLAGWLERQEMVRYLALADIGLLPDPQNGLNEYCTMVKALEYMAMGLPFVAFDLPETRASAGEAALYARPNEVVDFAFQLEVLLNSEVLRRTLGATGRRRIVEGLSWEYSRQGLLDAYETLFRAQETDVSS